MELRISPLGDSDKKSVYDFTIKWFFSSEPLTSSWEQLPGIDDVSYTKALDQGLSIAFVDVDDNLAALCINGMEKDTDFDPNRTLPSNLQKLYDFFDSVMSECEIGENYMSVLVVAVAEPYRRQGLCTRLMTASQSLAESRGFQGVKVLCTSSHSASSARAAGWTCVLSKPYSGFKHPVTGQQLYSPPPPHTHVTVFVKPLK